MSCRITELVIDCADPQRLADFWCAVLGFVELGWEGDSHLEIGPPATGFGGPQPTLLFARTGETERGKIRMHFDVNPTDRDQDAELERLLALGARKVDIGQGETASWHVLADPEGNEFCLLRRRLEAVAEQFARK
ncbi:VOC family protein [Nocardia huaxiensis]|uniref:VOC family protein n=1 Tax=Nocardia huaxiensis TaxID=2755382 RepID=A0A7D6V847_9NOCA|nr:VOC family protein [Nocardia huaxiensis]QLY28613.1 VOC family protein [Nocardia huaxiensis]UFS97916.1 VOC family protein [Nocardia huaxiensis]